MTTRAACLVCDRSPDTTPLIALTYRGGSFWICPQHLPILIHDPARLSGHLPDPEAVQTHFMAAHAAMGPAHWAEMQAGLQAMAVLTDEQRAKVKASMTGGGMQHRHGQGGQQMR